MPKKLTVQDIVNNSDFIVCRINGCSLYAQEYIDTDEGSIVFETDYGDFFMSLPKTQEVEITPDGLALIGGREYYAYISQPVELKSLIPEDKSL